MFYMLLSENEIHLILSALLILHITFNTVAIYRNICIFQAENLSDAAWMSGIFQRCLILIIVEAKKECTLTAGELVPMYNKGSITHNKANLQHLDEVHSVYLCTRMYNYHTGLK
jgi:hypothetical protein